MPHVIGIVWVRKEDYQAFLAMFADRDKMPDRWENWLKAAQKRENIIRAGGTLVERVYIDPETFPDWCRVHNCGVDAQGREKFVATLLAEKYRPN